MDPKSTAVVTGTLNRVWDGFRRLATITETLHYLQRDREEDKKLLLELMKMVGELAKEVSGLKGQFSGIEKRLEDKDKLVEATIALRVRDEGDKLRAELREEIRKLRAEL